MTFASSKEAIKYISSLKNTSAELKSREKADSLLEVLGNCDCCFRHTIHRPYYMNDNQWVQHLPTKRLLENGEEVLDLPYRRCKCFHMHGSFAGDEDDCKCPCRHYARIIQDTFDKN